MGQQLIGHDWSQSNCCFYLFLLPAGQVIYSLYPHPKLGPVDPGLFTASTSSVSLPQNSKHTYGLVAVPHNTRRDGHLDFLGTEVAQDCIKEIIEMIGKALHRLPLLPQTIRIQFWQVLISLPSWRTRSGMCMNLPHIPSHIEAAAGLPLSKLPVSPATIQVNLGKEMNQDVLHIYSSARDLRNFALRTRTKSYELRSGLVSTHGPITTGTLNTLKEK